MGQYYICVNVTKKEFLKPYDYGGNGAKLTEHSWQGNELMNAATNLLASRWSGDRIIWAGDYADEGLFVPAAYSKENLYKYAAEHYTEIQSADVSEPTYPYILNLDLGTYVDLRKLPCDTHGWQVHPLSLLTSLGNGRGSGDYHGPDEGLCGLWACDRIAVSDTVPEGYREMLVRFKED